MIGPEEKGFIPIKLSSPSGEESSFRGLPRYICYRAALLREKMILSYVLGIVSAAFAAYFVISRIEIYGLYTQLREKEYILAPGVLDFTPASPQSVPDSYVNDAVSDFLSTLGNVNSSNIAEQYQSLKRFMSDAFQIQFDADTYDWIEQVKTEDLAQILKVTEKKITSNEKGAFHVVAFGKADYYVGGESLGHEEQVIEIGLKLVPPEPNKRWYLQITNLSWNKLENFKAKKRIKSGEGVKHENN